MSNAEQIVKKIEELKNSDSICSYPHIKNIFANQRFPIPVLQYEPSKIIRYRRHYDSDPFYFEKSTDLSFRTDILNINNFGRCNEPGQGLFYCNDNQNENTGLTEAISIFRGNGQENSIVESFTIGAWKVKSALKLAVILPANEITGKNKEFDELKNNFKAFEGGLDFEDLQFLNEYISREFILDTIKNNSNYKVTCAYANYVKEFAPELDGIIYGSVKYENLGENIVLWPEMVDKKLDFFAARKLTLSRTENKTFIQTFSGESISYNKDEDIIYW